MLTIQQLNNLRDAAKHARQCELQSKVPSALILAQWALESGWGAHAPGNNCFGIKEYAGQLGRQLLHTTEYFTTEQFLAWLNAKPGRTGKIEDATPRPDGKFRYQVEDWFATFSSLARCFLKRADLFLVEPYRTSTEQFRVDGNFAALVQGIARHYATDPNYAQSVLKIAALPEIQQAIQEAQS